VSVPSEHAIYQVKADGTHRPVAEGVGSPAGLVSWRDDSTLAVGDAAGMHLWAFRVERDGTLTYAEPYYTLRTRHNEASDVGGVTLDAAGRLYAATREGVQVFDPTGRLSGIPQKPDLSTVTGVVFGRTNLDRLYVACGGNVYSRKLLSHGLAGASSTR
jgi:sugar lactone lactonase YvrE